LQNFFFFFQKMFFSMEIETRAAHGNFVPCEKLSEQYRGLVDGSTYRVVMTNEYPGQVDAILTIDGKVQGRYRLNPWETFAVERPADLSRSFVFVKENGALAREAGVVSNESENGLVQVEFLPRKKTTQSMYETRNTSAERFVPFMNDCRSGPVLKGCSGDSFDSTRVPKGCSGESFYSTRVPQVLGGGATALGENTSQKFTTVPDIPEGDVDKEKVTVLVVRLLAIEKPKLQAVRSIPSLMQPVPPPFSSSPFFPK
jgi:hypothetical protein